MPQYVALFRGINMGRANRVAMADLRALFVNLGYHDARTVLSRRIRRGYTYLIR
jgi:uncharacterized protein (DUF1697 family)